MDEMSRFFEDKMEPEIDTALKAGSLPWVSYNIVVSPRGGRVVHVITSDTTHLGWASFKDTIYAQFKNAPLPFTIVVHYGYLRFLSQDPPWKPFALRRSIGVEGVEGTGTMGGYVTLYDRKNSISRIYGLTNNHVVNKDTNTKKERPGPQDVCYGNKVRLPSDEDLLNITSSGNDCVNGLIGTLEHASGRRITTGLPSVQLDWALVAVSEESFREDREKRMNDYEVNSEEDLERKLPTLDATVRHRTSPDDGIVVAKYGRTTGATIGKVSSMREKNNIEVLEEMRGCAYHNPEGVEKVKDLAVFVPMSGRSFCEPGDSGSWIVDVTGKLVGLLFADNSITGRVLFTDISEVFKDIEARTGLKVDEDKSYYPI